MCLYQNVCETRCHIPCLNAGLILCAQEAVCKGLFRRSTDGLANWATVLTTSAEIAAGMAFLHARGLVHGDLSGSARLSQWLLVASQVVI